MGRLRQMGMWDEPYEAPEEPLSVRALVDATGGSQASGSQRAATTDDVEEAMWAFVTVAWGLYGEEAAAVLSLRLCARDPAFQAYPWLSRLWAAHREHLGTMFHRPEHGREEDWSLE